jgi:uncharacterized protein YceH (UPF0502 family)
MPRMAQIQLNGHEARVLGVLIEKSLTTPDQYPLSLNSATTGSNQKNNRWPVTDYTEAEVHVALQGLVMKHLAGRVVAAGSRVDKYRHSAQEALGIDEAHLAVLAELLMRGPQQPGELRGRADRMFATPTPEVLQARLAKLMEKHYVKRIPPQPGERAERYVQVLCPDLHALEAPAPAAHAPRAAPPANLESRVLALENDLRALREQVETLSKQLGVS